MDRIKFDQCIIMRVKNGGRTVKAFGLAQTDFKKDVVTFYGVSPRGRVYIIHGDETRILRKAESKKYIEKICTLLEKKHPGPVRRIPHIYDDVLGITP